MSGSLRFINNLHRLSFQLLRIKQDNVRLSRQICLSSKLNVRQVIEKTEGTTTVIEGKIMDSERKNKLLEIHGPEDMCPLCKLNMDIKYTDVMIISQFVQADGEIVPRQVTGLCYAQHAKMKELIRRCHTAGLMDNLRPVELKGDYSQRYIPEFKYVKDETSPTGWKRVKVNSPQGWKNYNIYFMEGVETGMPHSE